MPEPMETQPDENYMSDKWGSEWADRVTGPRSPQGLQGLPEQLEGARVFLPGKGLAGISKDKGKRKQKGRKKKNDSVSPLVKKSRHDDDRDRGGDGGDGVGTVPVQQPLARYLDA